MRKTYAFALLCALFCLNFATDLTEHRPLQEALTLQVLSLNVEFAFERHKLYACIEA